MNRLVSTIIIISICLTMVIGCKTPIERVIINDMRMDAIIIPPGEHYGPGTLVTYASGKWWKFGMGGYWTVLESSSNIVGTEKPFEDNTYSLSSQQTHKCNIKLDAATKNSIVTANLGANSNYIKEIELSTTNSKIHFFPEATLRSLFRKNIIEKPESEISKMIVECKRKNIKLYVTNYVLKTDFQYKAKTESGVDITAQLSSDIQKDITLEIIGKIEGTNVTTIIGNGLYYGFRKGNKKLNVIYMSDKKTKKLESTEVKELYQIDDF